MCYYVFMEDIFMDIINFEQKCYSVGLMYKAKYEIISENANN